MSFSRERHTATYISQDNSIFIAGGIRGTIPLNSTEKYMITTGCFNRTRDMLRARYWHTANQLPISSGLVVLAGGLSPSTLNVADLFNPITGNMTMITLSAGRYYQTSVLVGASKLVLIGGLAINTVDTADSLNATSPASFSILTDTMMTARHAHTTTNLGNHSDIFLITGGLNVWTPQSSVELYNGSSDTFINLNKTMSTTRCGHTATNIPSTNRIVIVGGSNGGVALNTMDVFDVNTMSLLSISSRLVTKRLYHTATLLPTGKILIVGGFNGTQSLSSCELIDTTNGNYSSVPAADLLTERHYHTATLISTNGRDTVLVCGGTSTSLGTLNSCELYFV